MHLHSDNEQSLIFFYRSYGCSQIKQLLSLRYIEHQTLVALDRSKLQNRRKKKVDFHVDKESNKSPERIIELIEENEIPNYGDDSTEEDVQKLERRFKKKQIKRPVTINIELIVSTENEM